MIKKITQKDFIEELQSYTGYNVSCCNFIINQTNIKTLNDVEVFFNKYNFCSESIKRSRRVKLDFKVEIKSNYLLLNNRKLDLKGKYFKFNDDILGVMDGDFLNVYYKNK